MTPYLTLCLRTWARNVPGYEVVLVGYANLDQYARPGTYDVAALQKCGLAVQKDAILAAVLARQGGIFMDADTIVTGDITAIVNKLAHTELVTFDRHLAFVVARPDTPLLNRWVERAQKLLARLNEPDPPVLKWYDLGNGPLEQVMAEMISASRAGRVYDAIVRKVASWPGAKRLAAENPIWSRRSQIFFRTIYRRHILMLDRRKHGFIAEPIGDDWKSIKAKYLKFWFEDRLPVAAALRPGQRMIALHHSWTPDWYKQLSAQEVLDHDCLLSRVLREILGPDAANALHSRL